MKISTILDQIDNGAIALPEFQRGYVWNRDQVRGLMDSLYRKHPVGSLLVWQTRTEHADARGDGALAAGTVKLLLDGQQRITTVYGISRGRPPKFFDGNPFTFQDLRFNIDTEVFEFYGPVKMRDDPRWVDVTELMQRGAANIAGRLFAIPELKDRFGIYLERLNGVASVLDIDLHMEEITGQDKTVDVVVEIFNKVNSGGTKLSKGDLALARICAEWPAARDEMQARIGKYEKWGFNFKLDWLLRNINTVLTGEAMFSALRKVDSESFAKALERTEKHIDSLLNLIGSRLGLDHDRVLGSRYSFPLMSRYLAQRNGHLSDHRERDRLLYWYIHTMLWGRYAGSTETVLNQDLEQIENTDGALDRLITQLRQNRGNLQIHPDDFLGWSRGARFYPLLYMLTRVWNARDWESGVELRQNLLGKLSSLQLHHIFPKALLYESGYERAEVNALANFTFLTQETNLLVSDRNPAKYLPEFMEKNPGAVESHWIPADPELWKIENYRDFLSERRRLLAAAANEFLNRLAGGAVPEVGEPEVQVRREAPAEAADPELSKLQEIDRWVQDQGLPEGEFHYELAEEDTGEVIALIDLAWPEGLQYGLSRPVGFLLEDDSETREALQHRGWDCYGTVEGFKSYVIDEVTGAERQVALA